MSFITFTVTSFQPNPLPAAPIFVQTAGSCAYPSALLAITFCPSGTKFTTGTIDPTLIIATINASNVRYFQLCECLRTMGTGSVQVKITYTQNNNGTLNVTDISSSHVALAGIEQQLSFIAANSAQIDQRLAQDLSGNVVAELRALNGLVSEVLSVLRHGSVRPGGNGVERMQSDFMGLAPELERGQEDVG